MAPDPETFQDSENFSEGRPLKIRVNSKFVSTPSSAKKKKRTGFYSGPLGDKVFIRPHLALRSATQPTWGRCPDCVASETSTPTLNGQRATTIHAFSRVTTPDLLFPKSFLCTCLLKPRESSTLANLYHYFITMLIKSFLRSILAPARFQSGSDATRENI